MAEESNFQYRSPSTFHLSHVEGMTNVNTIKINEVIRHDDVVAAIFSTEVVDVDWLKSEFPLMQQVDRVLIIHGEKDEKAEEISKKLPHNWFMHKPPNGEHHRSKFILLIRPTGLTVVVHTANLVGDDWIYKSQGVWMQEFPWKKVVEEDDSRFDFGGDLLGYLSMLKWSTFEVIIPTRGAYTIDACFFGNFDYERAKVRLVASVPGNHSDDNWGQFKLKSVLEQCTFERMFRSSPLVCQPSSLGSFDESWIDMFMKSMSAGFVDGGLKLEEGQHFIVWPTIEDISRSYEGYKAGLTVQSGLKPVEKKFIRDVLAKWHTEHTGCSRAMPGIQTYVRHRHQYIAWLLLTSAPLSKDAWGEADLPTKELKINSYELGVLFLASQSKQYKGSMLKGPKLVTLGGPDGAVRLPLPYAIPTNLYDFDKDIPWSGDRRYTEEDSQSQCWINKRPTMGFYTNDDRGTKSQNDL